MDGSKSCGSIARMSVTVVVPSMCRIKNSNFFLARITTIGSTKELTNNPLRIRISSQTTSGVLRIVRNQCWFFIKLKTIINKHSYLPSVYYYIITGYPTIQSHSHKTHSQSPRRNRSRTYISLFLLNTRICMCTTYVCMCTTHTHIRIIRVR